MHILRVSVLPYQYGATYFLVVLTTEKLDDISATETNFLHSFLLLTSADNQTSVRKRELHCVNIVI